MSIDRAIWVLALAAGAGMLAYGAWFLSNPSEALAASPHTADGLPAVMGGRYMFMGFVLLVVLLFADRGTVALIFAGLAGLGAIDAFIYWSTDPLNHALAGIAAGLACLYFAVPKKEVA